jgi:hypothetical protein
MGSEVRQLLTRYMALLSFHWITQLSPENTTLWSPLADFFWQSFVLGRGRPIVLYEKKCFENEFSKQDMVQYCSLLYNYFFKGLSNKMEQGSNDTSIDRSSFKKEVCKKMRITY